MCKHKNNDPDREKRLGKEIKQKTAQSERAAVRDTLHNVIKK